VGRRRSKFLSAVLLATCGSVSGQSTWSGLRFGMTEAETRVALKNRTVQDVHSDPNEQPKGHEMYTALKVTDVAVNGVNGEAVLMFSARTKRLAEVDPRQCESMIEQDNAALELMHRFADIWLYSIDQETMKVTAGNNGDKELQTTFAALERQFDFR